MADKNTGVGRERIGSRSDEQLTGRESTTGTNRAGEYGDLPRPATTSSSSAGRTSVSEPGPEVRTRQIRAEIEQTRGEMSETVNEIQERLRPGNIASHAAETVKEAASERMRDIAESDSIHYVRANPIPTAMVGIGIAGLAWLAFGGRDADEYSGGRYRGVSQDWRRAPRGYDAGVRYRGTSANGEYESDAYDFESPAGHAYAGTESYGTGSGVASNLSHRTGEMAREFRSGAEQTSRIVRQKAYRAQSQLQRTWNESPMLIGAAAAVLGALIGSAVPETERENQLMGETRDNMIEGVEQAVKDKVEQVQTAATDAVTQVQKAAGLTTDEGTSSGDSTTTGGAATTRPSRRTT
jgi:hypothetical protein